jgi:hypothetical protein
MDIGFYVLLYPHLYKRAIRLLFPAFSDDFFPDSNEFNKEKCYYKTLEEPFA